jgi:dihydrofolate synthase/folylpolyglutamate synthase
MSDKNVEQMASILFPLARFIVLVKPDNRRAMSPVDILRRTNRELWRRKAVDVAEITEILDPARNYLQSGDIVLIAGSLYLVGEAKKILNN